MKLPEKISFRPGPLAEPMGRKLKATGETPSHYLRRLVAEDPKSRLSRLNHMNSRDSLSRPIRKGFRP